MTNIVYPNGVNSTFGYDAEHRVTSLTTSNQQPATLIDRRIIRDARGFKITEDIYSGLLPVFTNELRQARVHNDADQLVSAGDTTYQYDSKGCLTSSVSSAQSVDYSYDYDNRLISVDSGNSRSEYILDADGSRIARIHTNGTSSVTNYFVIDYADGLKRPLAKAFSEKVQPLAQPPFGKVALQVCLQVELLRYSEELESGHSST